MNQLFELKFFYIGKFRGFREKIKYDILKNFKYYFRQHKMIKILAEGSHDFLKSDDILHIQHKIK